MTILDHVQLMLTHPSELRALINYKIWHDKQRDITNPQEFATSHYDRPSMRTCWDLLDLSSRSFSMVIKELEGDLARTVCLFYLVLRATDTIEDDMTISNAVKLPLLRSLHLKLHEPGWTFKESHEKDMVVLEQFDVIQAEFAQIDPKYQVVITDICRKMGAGMADFAALATPDNPVAEIKSIEDYDLYCHYVAGLVGEGLSGLFASSGKERPWIAQQLTLSNSMGSLLQKTNILRDVKEDVDQGRGFWPKVIWGKHGFNSMKELVDPAREKEALFAASEMTLDALRHATDALDYITLLKCQSVFNFVAIPAVMAMATLERCFMNPKILRGNVKIRRGEAVTLIMRAVNPRDVAYVFRDAAQRIHKKVRMDDPNLLKLSIACGKIEQWTEHHYPTFLNIEQVNGKPQTVINPASTDARIKVFTGLAQEAQRLLRIDQDRADAERREQIMADLVQRGIIPNKTPEEKAADAERHRLAMIEAENEPFPYLMVGGIVGGVLAAIAAMAAFIIWLVVTYLDDV